MEIPESKTRKNWEISNFIDSLFKPKCPPKLYHYTSMEVLFNNIIQKTGDKSKEEDAKLIEKFGENTYYVSLMLPTLRHTNDEKEISIGIELYNMIAKNKNNDTPANHYEDDLKDNTYSLSLSEEADSLALWNRYGGGKGKGVSIEFDTNFSDILYKEEEGKACIFEQCIYVNENKIDNIGQRIPPVALQRILVVSLKGYHP